VQSPLRFLGSSRPSRASARHATLGSTLKGSNRPADGETVQIPQGQVNLIRASFKNAGLKPAAIAPPSASAPLTASNGQRGARERDETKSCDGYGADAYPVRGHMLVADSLWEPTEPRTLETPRPADKGGP
jgi:hypothetical protein